MSEPTHVNYEIYLECKRCGHKDSVNILLRTGSTAYIGCSACKTSVVRFVVRSFVSWSSSSNDAYVKVSIT